MRTKKILQKIWLYLTFITILTFVTGCTTLRTQRQRLRVISEPPGAEVIVDGTVAGQTPLFVEIEREKRKEILLRRQGYVPQKIPLNTSYRWTDSFASNFIFLGLAPVAWIVDIVTGSAWDYERLSTIPLKSDGTKATLTNTKLEKTIAISPTISDIELLSDEIAEKIEKNLRAQLSPAKVLAYRDTEEIYSDFGVTYDSEIEPDLRDELSARLKATHMMRSKVLESSDEKILVEGKLVNLYTDKEEASYLWTFKGSDLEFKKLSPFKQYVLSYVSILPNSISLDTTTARATITASEPNSGTSQIPDYYSASIKQSNWLSVVSGLGVKNLRGPEKVRPFTFGFRFVPSLSIYYDKFRFDSKIATNPFLNSQFEWYTFQAGYGPEVSFDLPAGYFYLGFIPELGNSWIYYSTPTKSGSTTQLGIHLEVELGFSAYVSRNLNVRFYIRNVSASSQIWERTMKELAGNQLIFYSSNQFMGGFSFSYYFPESRIQSKRWLR